MVNDLITCYDTYKYAQPKLHEAQTQPERKAIADVVKSNYMLNKMAYNELEHYKKHGKLLGEHPLFKRQALKDAISAMNTPKLIKKIHSLKTNIFRNEQKGNSELVNRDKALLQHAEFVAQNR